MSAEANLLELQGYTGLAFFQAHDALSAYFTANPSLYDPPSNLLTMYQRLFTKMTTPGPALATTTSASSASSTFSPASRVVTLSATVLGASGPVDGGTVTFTVSKIGSPVTSTAFTQGAASAAFTIPAGTTAGIYSIQAVYNGTSVFSPSTDASQSLTISKAMPTINWNDPASVPAGTALGPSQLNAMASVPGTFVYNPPAGTVMTGSSTQTLNVTFTPADSTDYFSAIATVMITITPSPCASNLTASVAVTRSGFSYSPLLKRYAQTLTLTNTSGSTITGPIYVILDNLSTGAALYNAGGSTACAAPTGSPYTSIAGPIGAGASTNVVLQFSDPTNAAISYTTRFLAGTGQP
jgi:hypothetical protein